MWITSLVQKPWHEWIINIFFFAFFPQILSDFLTNHLAHCLEIQTKRCPMAKLGLHRNISSHLLNQRFASKKTNVVFINKHVFYLIFCQPFSVVYNLKFNVHKFFISKLKTLFSFVFLWTPFETVPSLTFSNKVIQSYQNSYVSVVFYWD